MGRVIRRKADRRRAYFAVLFAEGTSEDPQTGAHETFLRNLKESQGKGAGFFNCV